YLSGITGNTEYKDRVVKIRTFLKNKDKPDGLYQNGIDTDGNWVVIWKSFDDAVKAFYFNLLRSHLQSNRRDMESLAMYREALDAMIEAKMFRKANETYDYAISFLGDNYMYKSGCYLGAMLSRGAAAINNSLADHRSTATRHQELAQGITRTCYTATNRTKTGLTPLKIIFNNAFDSSNFLR